MVFDKTKGEKAKYIVMTYGWNVEDRYIFHSYNEARKFWKELTGKNWEKGTAISLYDVEHDIRKEYAKY